MTQTQSLEATLTKNCTITRMMMRTIPRMKTTTMTHALAMIAAYLAPQDHSPKANQQKRGFVLGRRNVAYAWGRSIII